MGQARAAAEDGIAATWGEPVDGLRLGLAPRDAAIELVLQNVGETDLEVLSHVAAGEIHLDWYTLRLQDAGGDTRTLRLLDARDESGVVRATVAPGESVRHRVAVGEWAARPVNGGQPLAPGTYQVSATYAAPPRGKTWSGEIEAGPVQWTAAS